MNKQKIKAKKMNRLNTSAYDTKSSRVSFTENTDSGESVARKFNYDFDDTYENSKNGRSSFSILSIAGREKIVDTNTTKLPKLTRKHHPIYLRLFYRLMYFISRVMNVLFRIFIKPIIRIGVHERSILIFYKNEESATRVPINNFTILFFVSLLSLLAYTGITAYNKKVDARIFYEKLSADEARVYSLISDYRQTLTRFATVTDSYQNSLKKLWASINLYEVEETALNVDNNFSLERITNVGNTLLNLQAYQKEITSFSEISKIVRSVLPIGWPVAGGGRITSGYGTRNSPFTEQRSFHNGVDIAGSYGMSIVSVADGLVTFAGWRGGYGWYVVIKHAHGYETAYGHNSKLLVSTGQRVKRGQVIANMGNTGRTTGIHCHFEVKVNGESVNPREYLNTRF